MRQAAILAAVTALALGPASEASANEHTLSVLAGYSYSNGTYSVIFDPLSSAGPTGLFTFADGINNLGQVVGTYGNAFGDNGYLYDGGSYYPIAVPGATGNKRHFRPRH